MRLTLSFVIVFLTLSVNAQNSQMVSALINGCGLTDGQGEYTVVYNGSTSLTVSAANLDLRYGTSSPASTTFTDSFVSLTIANTWAAAANLLLPLMGCSDLNFIGASTSSVIPAGSHIVILNDDNITTIDFSGWCGAGIGNIYVLLSNDTSWPTTGLFANQPAGTRYFRSIVNGNTTDFTYQNSWASNADGNYVAWNDGGGAPFVYSNYSSCNPTDIQSLPVDLMYFKGKTSNSKITLEWATESEQDNSHFEILRSNNTEKWESIAVISGKRNSNTTSYYQFVDDSPLIGRSFYKLIQHDFSGTRHQYEILSFYLEQTDKIRIYPNPSSSVIEIECMDEILEVHALDNTGRGIKLNRLSAKTFDINNLSHGKYLLNILTANGLQQAHLIKAN